MRILTPILIIALSASGCTIIQAIGQGSPSGPKDSAGPDDTEVAAPVDDEEEEEDEEEGEEEGVTRITRRLRKFRKALSDKQFDKARDHLAKAQRYVGKASALTRSHPDFEDVAEMVASARVKLDVAIERDRIARRNAAIDSLMRNGEQQINEGRTLLGRVSIGVVTEQDVASADEVLATFAEIRSKGSQYLDEARYTSHAKELESMEQQVRAIRQELRWLVDATDKLRAPVLEGFEAATKANATTSPPEKVRAYSQADAAFRACVATVGSIKEGSHYDKKRKIRSKLGTHTFDETRKRCSELARQARSQVDNLTWEESVINVVASISTPLSKVKTAETIKDELKASRAAAESLSQCLLRLDRTERRPGFDAKRAFASAFGKLSAVDVRKRCRVRRDELIRDMPKLEWRGSLSPLLAKVAETKRLEVSAQRKKKAADAVNIWKKAVGGFKECAEQARRAARKKSASAGLKLRTALGTVTVGELEKRCALQSGISEQALNAALKQREIDEFAATTQGDETEVVGREGITTKVEGFRDGKFAGRIFSYERTVDKKKEVRRYGFDTKGRRVDYWVEWRNQVVRVISEVSDVLEKVKKAPNASKEIDAVKKAMPVLDVCREVLTGGQKSPGYDKDARFETPFGRMTVAGLLDSCPKEKTRLRAGVTNLRWRVRAEDLAKRVDEAVKQLDVARRAKKPKERIERYGEILGGLDECVERAKTLPAEKGADSRFKVATSQGKHTVGALEKICGKLKLEAKKEASKAVADQRVEGFVKTCKSDEVEVARREGVPEEVEQVGSGRVFVYVTTVRGKKKTKRIAFNKVGKRIDESLLEAELKGPKRTERTSDGDTVPASGGKEKKDKRSGRRTR